MSGTLGYEDIRAGTVRQVAQLMAAAAITAPKSGGQLLLAGKPNFMETVIADDVATRRQLAAWMRARGKERRERIWFRDAEAAEAVDAILFVGLSLSMTHKGVGFDRPMADADFDNLDLPPTGTQPTGIPGATRHGGARNRQAPRQLTRRGQP